MTPRLRPSSSSDGSTDGATAMMALLPQTAVPAPRRRTPGARSRGARRRAAPRRRPPAWRRRPRAAPPRAGRSGRAGRGPARSRWPGWPRGSRTWRPLHARADGGPEAGEGAGQHPQGEGEDRRRGGPARLGQPGAERCGHGEADAQGPGGDGHELYPGPRVHAAEGSESTPDPGESPVSHGRDQDLLVPPRRRGLPPDRADVRSLRRPDPEKRKRSPMLTGILLVMLVGGFGLVARLGGNQESWRS